MTTTNTYGRQVVVPLTNKSGGGVIAGDVVIVGTANNDAFTTTTSAAFTGSIGIAQETIADNAVGRVLLSGYAALVNVTASVTRQNFGTTSTTVKKAVDAGSSRIAGTFCQFLTGGTTPDAIVWHADLGGGTGAPTNAKYLVDALDAGLSAEKAVPWLYRNYSKLNYPAAVAVSDEFDDSSLDGAWAWTVAPGGTVSESAYPGYLNIDGGTDASNTERMLLRAYVPGASTAFTVAGRCGGSFENGNFTHQYGIAVTDGSNGLLAKVIVASDGTTTGAKAYRLFFGTTPTQFASGTFAAPMASAPEYFRITRDASDNYRFYIAWDDGPGWQYIGTTNNAGTVGKIGLTYAADTDAINENAWWDYIRVFTGSTAVVGS